MKVLAVLLAVLSTVVQADIKPLIFGGTVVPAGTKTYQCGLRIGLNDSNICGGSLITPTHVLTAGHCEWSYSNYVSIGSHYVNGSRDGERIAIKKFSTHPKFDIGGFDRTWDYSIVELVSPSKYPPVKLMSADPETFAGAMATTMGWGLTSKTARWQPYELQRVDVPVLSEAQCKAAGIQAAPIHETMVCAGGVANRDACAGDSGGPLFLETDQGDVVFGIVSFGDGCGSAGKPGVYAKIFAVKDWILSIAPKATFV